MEACKTSATNLVVPLGYALSDQLHDSLQLLHWRGNATLDEFQFGYHGSFQFIEGAFILVDMLDSVLRLGVVADKIDLAHDGVEEGGESLGEAVTRGEQVANSLCKRLCVL